MKWLVIKYPSYDTQIELHKSNEFYVIHPILSAHKFDFKPFLSEIVPPHHQTNQSIHFAPYIIPTSNLFPLKLRTINIITSSFSISIYRYYVAFAAANSKQHSIFQNQRIVDITFSDNNPFRMLFSFPVSEILIKRERKRNWNPNKKRFWKCPLGNLIHRNSEWLMRFWWDLYRNENGLSAHFLKGIEWWRAVASILFPL